MNTDAKPVRGSDIAILEECCLLATLVVRNFSIDLLRNVGLHPV
jgi:hypothetical protein